MDFSLPHRRLNPLTGEWILVSPHRAKRPWLGEVEKMMPAAVPDYDPHCYLCPGNQRNTGNQNPPYEGVFVFDNDFAALLPQSAAEVESNENNGLFMAQPEAGLCRVVCFSPHHNHSLPQLSLDEVTAVVRTWRDQTLDLASRDIIHYVQVFENKGAMMGASNPHPHSQIWGISHIPTEPAKELIQQERYAEEHHHCLICDYLAAEKQKQERIVIENDDFTALVPFWAVWPFELMLVANRHCASLPELTSGEERGLADILRKITQCYDGMFNTSFPYSMGFHQCPFDGKTYPSWHFHAHYYPPLLRSATVKKFMVGFEMLAMPQRDLTPETAAERLRTIQK